MTPARNAQLDQEREEYRASIAEALQEDEDPLAAYDDFAKWTAQQYPADDMTSGLVELLEEITRRFKDDLRYKGDLRYLKLWSAYAKQVERPTIIYSYLVKHDIGCVYALLYEEYAGALEREGRHTEADKVFRIGITRNARPIERLKKRYRDFQGSPSSSKPTPITFRPSGSQEIDTLRRNPLKNHNPPPASSSGTSNKSSSSKCSTPQASASSPRAHGRYAPMLAPPVPGRRPEKLRFNLSLLFTGDGVEYSAAEVRARSMGLLNKKWGSPPPSEARETVRVNFNDDGTRSTQNMGYGKRKSIVTLGEPTVTINTKEALADVFGMYNSPDKTVKRMMPGSKHAPVKRIEPMTAATRQPPSVVQVEDENAKTPGAFKPFVDENANRKENSTPAVKFKPFVDEPPKQSFATPDIGRRALTTKDSTPATSFKPPATLKAISEENFGRENENVNVKASVFSRVFTPVSQKEPLTRPNSQGAKASPLNENPSVFQVPGSKQEAAPFVAFVDSKTPFKVFSRPPSSHDGSENAGHVFTPKPSTFKAFVDTSTIAMSENQVEHEAPRAPRTPASETYTDESSDPADDPQQNFSSSDEPFEDGYIEGEPDVPFSSSSSISDQFEEEYEEQPQPLGGRFGRINVMTPITERTFEFSTRGFPTPHENGAVETAEQLAAELREEDERERGYVHDGEESDSSFASYDRPGLVPQYQPAELEVIEERTGTLSLSDALAVVSAFRPSNPCNPFDPSIMSTLLSLLPGDEDFHDLRGQDSGMLEGLQKFAAKKSRRGSGSSSKGFDDDAFMVTLEGKRLKVVDKLGEGGFGAVFTARDVSSKNEDDEDEDEDLDEDDEEDGSSMLALKVVKPRNLWEFHVLRRIHRTLPEPLRHSLVLPYALYAYRDESHLLMQLCPQGTLLDIVNRAGTTGISQQGACLDELLVMFFTIEIMRFLEGMHNAGFIHGDLKIDNCLLRLEDVPGGASLSSTYQPSGEGGWKCKGVRVIDFGRTLDTSLFPHNQQFVGDWAADARDCFELREHRPWTYQTDYFGLAGIIYCMLFGKYIETSSITPHSPYKVTTPFKRYWQNDLWMRLFDLLLNPCLVRSDGKLPLCEELIDIRHEMEGWLQHHCNRSSNTLKGLLKKIELSVYTK
ncbi:uncharacterized protein F5891DRAFT_1253798 [Suillus fuscotomentosus]|uniref:Mad3/BUB1 homology region 1-domain-containing protein n=1 Tax=Suillus fuscotomentosus TaxID=1912939 RepID=A0AAD4EI85_9AGAM|nr:uncharacterized protein F5891DRAFT_1253798 [Suillus fuscotomentosus]KAG1905494.1 Mad3/BUB1 homology region 1-domain-containing protein [Suillus fuscotomentosus]